jgi:hypothetical protein
MECLVRNRLLRRRQTHIISERKAAVILHIAIGLRATPDPYFLFGKSPARPLFDALQMPRSVINAVTNRAGVTSKA